MRSAQPAKAITIAFCAGEMAVEQRKSLPNVTAHCRDVRIPGRADYLRLISARKCAARSSVQFLRPSSKSETKGAESPKRIARARSESPLAWRLARIAAPVAMLSGTLICFSRMSFDMFGTMAYTGIHASPIMKKMPPQVAKELKRKARAKRATLQRWCELTGQDSIDRATLGVLTSFTLQHGLKVVSRWIETSMERLGGYVGDSQRGRYISGIRRSELEGFIP